MSTNLTQLTETELKALAYDQINILETAQRNLKAINQELYTRSQTQKNKIEYNVEKDTQS